MRCSRGLLSCRRSAAVTPPGSFPAFVPPIQAGARATDERPSLGQLLHPPCSGPTYAQLAPLEPWLKRIIDIERRCYGDAPELCFGLESRVIFHLSEKNWRPSQLNSRELLLRPAFEPVTFSYWESFESWSIDSPSMLDLASCLAGSQLKYRDADCRTFADTQGQYYVYPPAQQATDWLTALPEVERDCGIIRSLASAFQALACAVLYHPLSDGNGRLGRALFQGALARGAGLGCPMLALAPLTYARGLDVRNGWIELGIRGQWDGLVATYGRALADLVAFLSEDAIVKEIHHRRN